MRALFVLAGLVAGNFFWCFAGDVEVIKAVERSFFQLVAVFSLVIADYLTEKAKENK